MSYCEVVVDVSTKGLVEIERELKDSLYNVNRGQPTYNVYPYILLSVVRELLKARKEIESLKEKLGKKNNDV